MFLVTAEDEFPIVETVDELVDMLGTDEFRRVFRVGRSAISNWKRSGFPPHTHYKVHRLAARLRVKLADGLLEEPDLEGVATTPA